MVIFEFGMLSTVCWFDVHQVWSIYRRDTGCPMGRREEQRTQNLNKIMVIPDPRTECKNEDSRYDHSFGLNTAALSTIAMAGQRAFFCKVRQRFRSCLAQVV